MEAKLNENVTSNDDVSTIFPPTPTASWKPIMAAAILRSTLKRSRPRKGETQMQKEMFFRQKFHYESNNLCIFLPVWTWPEHIS